VIISVESKKIYGVALNKRKSEILLRSLIREEINSRLFREAAQTQQEIQAQVATLNLQPEISSSVAAVKSLQGKIQSATGIDGPTLGLLLAAAIAVSGRESTYGQGTRYQWTNWAESLMSQYGVKDASIGPTQVKYGQNFGPGTALAGYGQQVGITGPESLGEYPKAIMATIGMLSKLYLKAKSLGYSTDKPGIASKSYASTNNAALDLALIGYNMGDAKVTNYCGTEAVKKPCADGAKDVAVNYIPNFTDGGLSSLGYISEVSKGISRFSAVIKLF